MAHNPSFVGKTHVVTHHSPGRYPGPSVEHSVIGVFDNYGSARGAIDKHLGTSAKKTGVEYHHPDDDMGEEPAHYLIHREDKRGWNKV